MMRASCGGIFDVAIVGGGAAGLAAAVFAGRRGARSVVVEKLSSPGRKLLAAGGGHCNVTNRAARDKFYAAFGRSGRFIAPALERFDNGSLEVFFSGLGVPLHSPDGFHVFPRSGKGADILDALLSECRRTGVEIVDNCRAEELLISDNAVLGVRTSAGEFRSKRVVISTGGMSYPELGSDGDGYRLAKSAGHSIVTPVPALVELHCPEKWVAGLAGVSLKDVELSVPGSRIKPRRGEFLFTHRGVSGPAVLDISGDVAGMVSENGLARLSINFMPGVSRMDLLAKFAEWRRSSGGVRIVNLLSALLPKSLAGVLCELSSVDFARASQMDSDSQNRLLENATGLTLNVNGTGGFAKAMLTKGGVSLKELDPRTLESRIVGGLHFAGEVLDLQGDCGGYNLQWAFSSGILAQGA